MEIVLEATIKKVDYSPLMCPQLPTFHLADIKSGVAFSAGSFLLKLGKRTFAVSHWTGPKRSRTYPLVRVYNTYAYQDRVTIIPFMKDEGAQGEPDFLQWDTVSLMSLLRVKVIPAYYKTAVKSHKRRPGWGEPYENKITQQKFDYEYLVQRFKALARFQSDAIHWNVDEISEHIVAVAQRTKMHYEAISKQTGVALHGSRGIDGLIKGMKEEVSFFREHSRKLAKAAQLREIGTKQHKERLLGKKAPITIKNYLGGYYYWTLDEVLLLTDRILLIEKKHSSFRKLDINQIKEACLKMVLFANLDKVFVSGRRYKSLPVIGLTSDVIEGFCHSKMPRTEVHRFLEANTFHPREREILLSLFREANANRFYACIASAKTGIEQILASELG